MQIALTKNLADGLKLKAPAADENVDPIFTWTANWICVWSNRRAKDLLVLVNNKTRFAVAVYEVKRKDLKKLDEKIKMAIKNTLLNMSFNPDMVDKYMALAGDVNYVKNSDRKASSWVSKAGQECSMHVGRAYNGVDDIYDDTIASNINYMHVNCDSKNEFMPCKAFAEELSELTGLKAYKNEAYELTITLDLEIYKATRKIIVPSNMNFYRFHKVLQEVFNWKDEHLFEYGIASKNPYPPMLFVEGKDEYNLSYFDLMEVHKKHQLSEIFSQHEKIIYTYDYGDCWQHEIQVTKMIKAYEKELPYLIEASGQTPPENVGGVGGFLEFRNVMLDENHPEYKNFRTWAPYWRLELREWETKAKVIHLW